MVVLNICEKYLKNLWVFTYTLKTQIQTKIHGSARLYKLREINVLGLSRRDCITGMSSRSEYVILAGVKVFWKTVPKLHLPRNRIKDRSQYDTFVVRPTINKPIKTRCNELLATLNIRQFSMFSTFQEQRAFIKFCRQIKAPISFVTACKFQENLLKTMIQIENTFFELGRTCQRNCLIICDRGAMDASACKF